MQSSYFELCCRTTSDQSHCFSSLLSSSSHTEPTDGFHPSQTGNALFAQKFFEWLDANHPEALGPVNPHNDEIAALFPNQF